MSTTMRDHLRKVHEQSAEFHLSKAKTYGALGKSFGNMRKARKVEDDDTDDNAEDIASALAALAEEETSMSEFHVSCCKSLDAMGKAAGMSGDELMPDNVFGYLPEVPSNIRPVLRAGQRDIGEMAKVDDALAHLVKIDD